MTIEHSAFSRMAGLSVEMLFSFHQYNVVQWAENK